MISLIDNLVLALEAMIRVNKGMGAINKRQTP